MTPQRFFYVLSGLLAMLILAGGAGYYWASRSLEAGTAQLSQSLGDEQLADQEISGLENLQKQSKLLEPLVPVITAALPSQKDESAIAVQLRTSAASSGMNLDNLTFAASAQPGPASQTVVTGGVLALPISFQLQGTYQQLQAFLQQQEHLSRYTSVTSLTISSSGSSELTFAISLNAFLKP